MYSFYVFSRSFPFLYIVVRIVLSWLFCSPVCCLCFLMWFHLAALPFIVFHWCYSFSYLLSFFVVLYMLLFFIVFMCFFICLSSPSFLFLLFFIVFSLLFGMFPPQYTVVMSAIFVHRTPLLFFEFRCCFYVTRFTCFAPVSSYIILSRI